MWGVNGRFAFLAEEVGATRVTGFDGMDPTPEFLAEHNRRNSAVRYIQGDLHDPIVMETVGIHDVVLCTGLYYHSPNPYLQFEHLHRITGEWLLLGGHTIPEIPGFDQACLWYPEMPEDMRKVLARAYPPGGAAGVANRFSYEEGMGYAQFWWGVTRSALCAMVSVAGFEITQVISNSAFMTHLVARRIDRPSVIPAPEFPRERGEQLGHNLPGRASGTKAATSD
jgi:hypothetical protein